MKVAIVINTSWNIFNFRMGLLKALMNEGHEVIAIAPRDEFSEQLEKEVPFVPVKMEAKGSNPLKDLKLIYEFYLIYKKLKPDCILHYTIKPNIYGTIAAKLLSIPCVNNVSGLGTVFLHKNLVSKVAKTLYKIAFKFPYKVFFQNKDDQKLFISQNLVKAAKTDLVPGSGVNLNYFKPLKKEKSNFKFLLIGRLLYDKGIVEYAQAARILREKYPETEFWLAGAFDTNKKLGVPQNVIKEWDHNNLIKYKGFTKDVRALISEVDCVVLPSYREGTPKTLLEAGAMAKPLVATNVPGCKEAVSDEENGYLAEVKNAEDLAEKMEKILKLPDVELEQMGKNSRKMIENRFSEEKVINKYIEVLNQIATRINKR